MIQSNELTSILTASVSPVILISGVGLLILSMTNRFARVVDRSRLLMEALRNGPQSEQKRLRAQLEVLTKRGQLLRAAVTFATLSVLASAILVIALFLTAFLHMEIVLLSVVLFIACLTSLIISLIAFLRDINLSLAALKLEIELRE